MINKNDQKRIVTNEDLYDLVVSSIEDLRKSTLDGFDRVFEVIDEAKTELRVEFKKDINDLRVGLKNDITDLRKEMNQRFSVVDKRFTIIDDRLSSSEDNMVYKHQLSPKFA